MSLSIFKDQEKKKLTSKWNKTYYILTEDTKCSQKAFRHQDKPNTQQAESWCQSLPPSGHLELAWRAALLEEPWAGTEAWHFMQDCSLYPLILLSSAEMDSGF